VQKKKNIVLVADKDSLTYKILDIILDKSEFQVVECQTGKQALQLCVSIKPDIMLLEHALPDIDGLELIPKIREWSQMPVIIVSSRSASEEVVRGLEMGADDYVIKPFNADVLRARINTCLRKSAILEAGTPEISNGPLRMDLTRHQVFLGEELITLTPKEYKLLRFFITHTGIMLGHREILHEVWGPAHSENKQYLRVFVGQLREKIEKQRAMPAIITTELGIGYRMEILKDLPDNQQGELPIG